MYGTILGDLYTLDWNEPRTVEYWSKDGHHTSFDKYEFDFFFGTIRNKKTGEYINYGHDDTYNSVTLLENDGVSRRCVLVARAVLSTFVGKPKEGDTAEHLDCLNKSFDTLISLVWIDKKGQNKNRVMPNENLNAFLIDKEIETKDKKMIKLTLTAKQWVDVFAKKNIKNHMNRPFTEGMIRHYAQNKQHGFSYCIFEDIYGEIWKKIKGSKTNRGHLEISNKCRLARVTKFARNVMDEDRLGMWGVYPVISINGKNRFAHDVIFETFFPEDYKKKKKNERVLHKFDNKLDFTPENLYLGDQSQNMRDAYDNGKRDGSLNARRSCESYIDGIFEKHHESLIDAEKYLRKNDRLKACGSSIGRALDVFNDTGKCIIRYGRTWKPIDQS